MRSKDTVISAVTKNTTVSARVEPMTLRSVVGETMRAAVTIRTPARAASGIRATGPVAR